MNSFDIVIVAINILLLPVWLVFCIVWVASILSFAFRRPLIFIPLYVAVYVDTTFYDRETTTHHAIQRCLESTPWNTSCCALAVFTALLVCLIGCKASRAAVNALLLVGVLAWLSLVASLVMMKQGEGETALWPFIDVLIVGALATVPDITEVLLSILLRINASELVNSSSLSPSEKCETGDLTPFVDPELITDTHSNMIFQKTVIAFGAGIIKAPSDPWRWQPLSWRNQLHLVLALGAPLGFLRCLWPRYLALTQSLPLYNGITDKEWLVITMIIVVIALRYWDIDMRDPRGREGVKKESV